MTTLAANDSLFRETPALRRAIEHHQKGDLRAAIVEYQRASDESSTPNPNLWYWQALTLQAMRDYKGAAMMLTAVLELAPDHQPALYNLGVSLETLGKYEQAMARYRQAIALKPGDVLPNVNLGGNLYRLGRDAEGYAAHSAALASTSANVEGKTARSVIRLLRGDYEKGWQEYERRWHLPEVKHMNPVPTDGQRWDGRDLKGKKVLLYHEQGTGDTLQFLRYVPLVKERGGVPLLLVQPDLKRLVSQAMPSLKDVPVADYRMPHYHAPLLSLPLILGCPDPFWTGPLITAVNAAKKGAKARVGICWRGSKHHNNDLDRSIHDITLLAPLLKETGVEWQSLQHAAGAIYDIRPLPNIVDYAGTASVVAGLDLVITVDTSIAHLAASMGKPVWLLPPTAPEFRWGLRPADCDWYPTVRLYRRTRYDAWPECLERVRTDLLREFT